jgi:hypothetical protein
VSNITRYPVPKILYDDVDLSLERERERERERDGERADSAKVSKKERRERVPVRGSF